MRCLLFCLIIVTVGQSGCSPITSQPQRIDNRIQGSWASNEQLNPNELTAKAGETIRLDGEISEASLNQIRQQIEVTGGSRLIITSTGGRSDHAIKLEALLKDKKVHLEVKDYCFSACAHFLALSRLSKSINEDQLVGFHHTSTSMKALVAEDPDPNVRSFFDATSSQEIDYVKSEHLDPRILLLPHIQIQPSCYMPIIEAGRLVSVNFVSRFKVWTPSAGSIAKSLWWPKDFRVGDVQTVSRNIVRVVRPDQIGTVFIQYTPLEEVSQSYDKMKEMLGQTRRCDSDTWAKAGGNN